MQYEMHREAGLTPRHFNKQIIIPDASELSFVNHNSKP